MVCIVCSDSLAPAVWRYNMRAHIQSKHPTVSLARYASDWELTRFETTQMAAFWNGRKKVIVHRPGKAKEGMKIIMSEAHTSTVTLANSTGEDDDDGSDSEQSEDGLIKVCFHFSWVVFRLTRSFSLL